VRRSCSCVGLARSAWYAPPLDWTVGDAELIAALARLVEEGPSRDFWKCCQLLGRSHPVERQADLSGVLRHEAQLASDGQAPAPQAGPRSVCTYHACRITSGRQIS